MVLCSSVIEILLVSLLFKEFSRYFMRHMMPLLFKVFIDSVTKEQAMSIMCEWIPPPLSSLLVIQCSLSGLGMRLAPVSLEFC